MRAGKIIGAFTIFAALIAALFAWPQRSSMAFLLPPYMPEAQERPSALYTQIYTGGGGPTSSGVNQNSPKIGNCGAPNRNNSYEVSTCDGQIDGQLDQIEDTYVAALMKMAEEFSAVMLQQMQILGTQFDAKEQLEAQRDIQRLSAQAHRDYHPSEQLCAYGSGVRSLAHTEEKARANKLSLDQILAGTYSNRSARSSMLGSSSDMRSRIEQFKSVYCDPSDNNNRLWSVCYGISYNVSSPPSLPASADPERFNKDINYNGTFKQPLTLDIDFTDDNATNDEEDLLALGRNLYWPRALDNFNEDSPNQDAVAQARANIARISLAQNSFSNIVALKARSPGGAGTGENGDAYLKAVMREFGLSEAEIEEIYGENASYFAQTEILMKKMYQHPDFYTNLYDKSSNIDRINATLEALQLIQGRDRMKSMLRREMLAATLLEDDLFREEQRLETLLRGLR